MADWLVFSRKTQTSGVWTEPTLKTNLELSIGIKDCPHIDLHTIDRINPLTEVIVLNIIILVT